MLFQNLKDVAFVGDAFVKGPIRAVVLSFHGLNFSAQKLWPDLDEIELAAHGALCIYPYYGPWSWMNAESRRLVDEIVERAYAEFGLSDEIPLFIRGGSMGGYSALVYALNARRRPKAVACNCPVTDPEFHLAERSDLPRTFLLAYGLGEKPLEEVLIENSPLRQAGRMPRVPYFIVHGTVDPAVNKQAHSDRFVKRMRELGHEVNYVEAEGMGHCGFVDYDVYRQYQDFILSRI
ncbi:MAG: prolyl oligopeptidase family serine peptidase [Christensenellaceae bacterium]|jgi:dipeptidyl aminopeptidase/acylaminoacyl peptidase|nr:prolyl oligopeptidase family serine peptidase [Christensenellaceae bacterium]